MAENRNPTTNNPGAVFVATGQGQFLHFSLTAGGPTAVFTFTSNVEGTLWEPADFPGPPKTLYEWDHLRNPSDIQQLELLTLALAFFSNAQYTYTVDLCDRAGTVLQTVMNIQYTGSPTDYTFESLRVIIQ